MEPEKNTSLNLHNKGLDIISFFDKDADFVFVFKKTEKLTTALYMITNLFSDSEPMKWTLREKVNSLLSHTIRYKDTFASDRIDFVLETKTRALEIVSFLEVSSRAGLISGMNFSILKQEFLNLISVIDTSRVDVENSRTMFGKNFFDVPVARTESRVDHTTTSVSVSRVDVTPYTSSETTNQLKDKVSIQGEVVFKKNNRQSIILQLLKRKKELTIKDIAETIKDCSEKTIQRELIALISIGVLKKTGERRWSKYSLVSPIV